MVRLKKINLLEQITSGPANSDKMCLLWKRGSGVTMKIPKKIQLRKMPGEPKKAKEGRKIGENELEAVCERIISNSSSISKNIMLLESR